MRKYAVRLGSLLIYIFSYPPTLEDALAEITDGSMALLLLPSESADLKVTVYGKERAVITEPRVVLAALSFFFSRVRSLPSLELDVEYNGRIYALDTCQEGIILYDTKPYKCKEIVTNNGLKLYDITCGKLYRALSVTDTDLVDKGKLITLRLMDEYPLADAVCAVSFWDNPSVIASHSTSPYLLLSAVLSLPLLRGVSPSGYVLFNGERIGYRYERGGLLSLTADFKYMGALD